MPTSTSCYTTSWFYYNKINCRYYLYVWLYVQLSSTSFSIPFSSLIRSPHNYFVDTVLILYSTTSASISYSIFVESFSFFLPHTLLFSLYLSMSLLGFLLHFYKFCVWSITSEWWKDQPQNTLFYSTFPLDMLFTSLFHSPNLKFQCFINFIHFSFFTCC